MATPIYLNNTLHRRKETFEPLNPPDVGMYSCGPTVYNYAHIGNLRSYIFADVLRRTLEYNGYNVTQIMNITDVGHLTSDRDEGEDKMEKGAKREGKTVFEIAEFYTDEFKKDLKNLNINEPAKWTKATEHIQEQIDLVKTLEKKGFTYATDDGIYFDTSKFPDYGKMAKLDLENLEKGARVEFNKQKRNASDFALWKFSPKDEQRAMEWDSPWGKGFPGWHLECSAMAMKYLGDTFDIHTGGIDHIPVHHTNEIAQSEAATDKPFVKYWLHNEFITINPLSIDPFKTLTLLNNTHVCPNCGHPNLLKTKNDYKKKKEKDGVLLMVTCRKCHKDFSGMIKMAKSSGNFIRLQSILDKNYDALDYRFLVLLAHYRKHMTFSWAAMDAAREGRERINQFARRIHAIRDQVVEKPDKKYLSKKQDKLVDAFNDDLNTPVAFSIIFDVIKDINSQLSNNTLAVSPTALWGFLLDADKILGLKIQENAEASTDIPLEVKELLATRQLARDNRDYEASDRLRDQIKDLGYTVEDTDQGQQVHPVK